MINIKQLFNTKKEDVIDVADQPLQEDRDQIRITYYQSGIVASIKASGKPIVFKACLQNLYNSFEDQCRRQKEEQEKLKQPYREDQEKCKTEIKKYETGLAVYENRDADIAKNIEVLKQDIVEVKNTPEKFIEGIKGLTAQFYIGLLLLFPITLYLLVFYVSASYSAFFKVFNNDSLTAAIFDKDAFNNAFQDSWLEGTLVITIPFVFMGLGYVIHMMQKGKGVKNILRLAALFIITFLFDALLAYQIEKKIYQFNATLDTPPYNLITALGEPEFWMIIFAGFVVYIIWGLVFDHVMKEYENIDKIKMFIKARREEIFNLEKQKQLAVEKISDFKEKIIAENGKISVLQSKIDGFIFPVKEYLLYHSQYKEGWFQAIMTEIALPHKEKNELLESCETIAFEHLKDLSLNDGDFQHLVYSKN